MDARLRPRGRRSPASGSLSVLVASGPLAAERGVRRAEVAGRDRRAQGELASQYEARGDLRERGGSVPAAAVQQGQALASGGQARSTPHGAADQVGKVDRGVQVSSL